MQQQQDYLESSRLHVHYEKRHLHAVLTNLENLCMATLARESTRVLDLAQELQYPSQRK